MPSISKTVNKVSRALKAKGMMPLINQSQFYGVNGPVNKYIVHYGQLYDKKDKAGNVLVPNNIIGETYSKVELLNILISVLKAGDPDG